MHHSKAVLHISAWYVIRNPYQIQELELQANAEKLSQLKSTKIIRALQSQLDDRAHQQHHNEMERRRMDDAAADGGQVRIMQILLVFRAQTNTR